jgi:hypothetical protein
MGDVTVALLDELVEARGLGVSECWLEYDLGGFARRLLNAEDCPVRQLVVL